MESSSEDRKAPASETSTGTDVLALAPPPSKAIATRNQLSRTRLGEARGIISEGIQRDVERPSLVTRRNEARRRRRKKRVLIGVAIVLGLFPPVWAAYLIAWLVWRSRPKQQSMRGVKKAVRALEKNQTGVALKRLQEAHLLDPANNDALYWLGLVLSRQERHNDAAEALSLVSERVAPLPEVEAALVDAYVQLNEPESAIYHAQRLFDIAPYDTQSLIKLAEAFESAERLDMAIEALEQAPLHKPVVTDELVQIHYRLGTLYERKGDDEQALHHYRRVYTRDLTYRDARARMKALEAKTSD